MERLRSDPPQVFEVFLVESAISVPVYRGDLDFGDGHEGADVLAFMGQLHHVINDTFDPTTVVIDGGKVAMVANRTITALQDLPDLPAGPMSKDVLQPRVAKIEIVEIPLTFRQYWT